MRVAWCTPLAPESAIGGRYSRPVVAALGALGAEVDLWFPSTSAPAAHGTGTATAHTPPRVLDGSAHDELSTYDLVVFNIGNHAGNHAAILRAAQAVSGVVVLHDLVLHHLHHGMAGEDPGRYAWLVQEYGGGSAPAGAPLPLRDEEAARHPLFEPALVKAHGVVVHSRSARTAVRSRFLGPVLVAHLPYDAPRAPGARPAAASRTTVTAITVGHVNANKKVETVLQAIGRHPRLRERLEYVVCGPVEPEQERRLLDLAAVQDVHLRLLGAVDDDGLHRALLAADLSINLRHPVYETGSASLVEAMLYALPTVVPAAGAYADVPESCGIQVPAGCPVDAVGLALLRLVDEPALRQDMGRRARAHALETHDARRYAAELLDLAGRRGEEVPARELVAALAGGMRLVGAEGDSDLAERAAGVAAELFGRTAPTPGPSACGPTLQA